MSSVSANDLDDSSIMALDDSNDCISFNSLDSNNLFNDEGVDVVDLDSPATANEPIANGSNDFDELSYKINNTSAGGILELDRDYKFTNDTGDASTKGIVISKSITIDGRGHTINANKLSRVFNITADNVILKNINFINGNALG